MKYHFKRRILGMLSAFLVFILTACGVISKGYTGYSTNPGKNQSETLRMFGGWTKTGIGSHYHCGADPGPFTIFGLEGLAQYVRTTDIVIMLLASNFTHYENETIVTLRDDAYWHDGEPVESMDFLAYYYLNHNETTGYMERMDAITNKQFKITWKSYLAPSDEAKTLLLAQDTKSATVPYHIFKTYADQAIALTNSLPDCPEEESNRNAMYFNKYWNGDAATAYGEIYSAFRAHVVDGEYPATGPYRIERYTETQMILTRNENYYLKDTTSFKKIIVTYQPSESVAMQMIASGQIDYMDGTPMRAKLESILQTNGSLVHYKYLDQGTIGLLFNLEKETWVNDKVREAFQYIFDRETIKNIANPYAETSWKAMSGMADYEAEKYLNPDDYLKMKDYSYNLEKATQLLTEAGWSKKNNTWYNEKNEKVSLTLGYIGSDPYIPIATTVQNQIMSFGIDLTLKSTESPTTLLANARITNSEYDLMIYFTALNPWGSHPGGALKHMYAQMDAAMMHIPVDENDGKYALYLNKADGTGTFRAYDLYEKIYTLKGDALRVATADLIVGFAEKNYGIDFYNNVTGSFFNLDNVGNLPLEDLFSLDRNITNIYHYNDAEFDRLAKLNIYYCQATSHTDGTIIARK